jgi:hypothetical protein
MATPPSAPVDYRRLSLWHETADDDWTPRPSLDASTEADVVVVGAGFTGLWTAYYLAQAEPGLRILVLEREVAGFGASGRNGGWCSALFPASAATIARRADRDPARGRDAAVRMLAAMRDTVGEVGRVVAAEGIDAHWQQGGTLSLARSAVQLRRLQAEVAEARDWGVGADDLRMLDAGEAVAACSASGSAWERCTPRTVAVVHARPCWCGAGSAPVERSAGPHLRADAEGPSILTWQVDNDGRVPGGARRGGGVRPPRATPTPRTDRERGAHLLPVSRAEVGDRSRRRQSGPYRAAPSGRASPRTAT